MRLAHPRSAFLALAVLLALASVLKIAILLAPGETLYLQPGGDPANHYQAPYFHVEEIHRGTTTLDLIEGRILPLEEYQYAKFFGGSLVVSVLAVPFFAVFGPCLFALKLTGLVFNALMVLFVFLILDRLAGRRAAWLGGLLAALPPPGYVALTLTAFGTHMENNAFAMAIVYVYLRAFEHLRPRAGILLLLGILAGFAMYFGYVILLTLAVLALHRALNDPGFFRQRGFAFVLLGFLIGASPWAHYNLTHDLEGLGVYGAGVSSVVGSASERLANLLSRTRLILFDAFPGSAFFGQNGMLANGFFALALVALALFAGLARAPQPRPVSQRWLARLRSPRMLLVAYPLLFLAIAVASTLGFADRPGDVIAYRYVYVVYPYLFLAAGLGLDALWRRGRTQRALGLATWSALLLLATWGSARLVQAKNFGATLDAPAFSREGHGRFLVMKYSASPGAVLAALERSACWSNPDARHRLHFGVGVQLQDIPTPAHAGERWFETRDQRRVMRTYLREHVQPAFRVYFADDLPRGRRYTLTDYEPFLEGQDHEARQVAFAVESASPLKSGPFLKAVGASGGAR